MGWLTCTTGSGLITEVGGVESVDFVVATRLVESWRQSYSDVGKEV